jgi:hypothetical protein
LLIFDFADSNKVALKAGHVYAFELQGIRDSAPLFWRRTATDTYAGGAACCNRAVIAERAARCDFAMAVYGAEVSKTACSDTPDSSKSSEQRVRPTSVRPWSP